MLLHGHLAFQLQNNLQIIFGRNGAENSCKVISFSMAGIKWRVLHANGRQLTAKHFSEKQKIKNLL